MARKQMSKFLLFFWCLGQIPGIAFALQDTTITIHASQMNFSKKVDNVGDHIVFWGMASGENTWISHSLAALSLSSFSLEVEAGADTAARRWPKIGIAFNDANNILDEFEVASLVTTRFMQLGQFTPGDNDTIIYFVFTNDYWDPNKGHDVNLKLRKIRFTGKRITGELPITEIDTVRTTDDSVRVSWQPNTESDLAGYKIYYGKTSRNYAANLDVERTTSHVLKLPVNQTYHLAVQAYDQSGNPSEFSDEVVFYLEKENPDQPVSIKGDSVTVRWDANTELDLAGYIIYYGQASRTYADSLDVGRVTSSVLKLLPDRTYFLALKAYDQTGNLSQNFSNEVIFALENSSQINCDINEDGLFNLDDWLTFNASLNSKDGESRFRKNADFNKDGKIDHADQKIAETTCMNPWSGITNN